MTNLMLTLPELILTIGAIILMLVAAWRGDDATPAISIAEPGLSPEALLNCASTS